MTDITKATKILTDIKTELDDAINCLSDNQVNEQKGAAPSAIPASFANIVPEANLKNPESTEPNSQIVPTAPEQQDEPTFTPAMQNQAKEKPATATSDGDITTKLLNAFNAMKEKVTPTDVKNAAANLAPQTESTPSAASTTEPEPVSAVPTAPQIATKVPESTPEPAPAPESTSEPAPESTSEPAPEFAPAPTPAPTSEPEPVFAVPTAPQIATEVPESTSIPAPESTSEPAPQAGQDEPNNSAGNSSFDALSSILNSDATLPSQNPAAPTSPALESADPALQIPTPQNNPDDTNC